MLLLQLSLTDDGRHSKHTDTDCRVTDIRRIQTTHLHLQAANNTTCTLHTVTCMHSTFNFSKTNAANMNYRVSQKSEPLNILQQQPQICSDSNKILHTQDDIWYKHYYIVSYKSALTLLKYEFLNNINHKSWVSFAVDVSQNSQNVHSSKRPVSSRKFNH